LGAARLSLDAGDSFRFTSDREAEGHKASPGNGADTKLTIAPGLRYDVEQHVQTRTGVILKLGESELARVLGELLVSTSVASRRALIALAVRADLQPDGDPIGDRVSARQDPGANRS
jgi:hypothetical protein